MRGHDIAQGRLFVTRTVASFVPAGHPLLAMRKLVDEALKDLDGLFNTIYASAGRESIPPERLIRASLLQILFSIRSERQLVEQIEYNMLYRWFVGLELEDPVWNHSTFSKNRDRLLDHAVFEHFFDTVLAMAKKRKLLSDEHFSVDGTLLDAWASHGSLKRRDGSDDDKPGGGKDFRGETRSNKTHVSGTDPQAELMKKSEGTASRLSYGVDALMENRNGMVVGVGVRPAASVTERDGATDLLAAESSTKQKTVGCDKGYDTHDFVHGCRELNFTPHVAMNVERRGGTTLDGRTTRHAGYLTSMICRRKIESVFGWVKEYGGLRRMKYRGKKRVAGFVQMVMASFNLLRMRNIESMAGI
ncbi:MAG TPA: IS5 family transposase [Flavisolibacter sp.]|nr:IS5 family transposase [Flavisolibacter sp.]